MSHCTDNIYSTYNIVAFILFQMELITATSGSRFFASQCIKKLITFHYCNCNNYKAGDIFSKD